MSEPGSEQFEVVVETLVSGDIKLGTADDIDEACQLIESVDKSKYEPTEYRIRPAEDDGLRADSSGEAGSEPQETGSERLERFCATCGSTDLSTASVREGTYECGGCGHVVGRTHVRRVGGGRGV